MRPTFAAGDFIAHKNPYPGEPEKLITEIVNGHYRCAVKHPGQTEWDFGWNEMLSFENAERYYTKVG